MQLTTALRRNRLKETIKRITKPYRLLVIDLCALHIDELGVAGP
jgi:hypothetical protein